MIKAVLFDMDGVLIDTEKYLTKYIREAAAEFGYDMSEEVSYSLRSFAFKYAAPEMKKVFGKDFDYLAIRNRRKKMMEEHIKEQGIEKKPYVEAVIMELKKRGYKTAVVTATDEERAGRYLEMVGFTGLFDEIVCASMVENGKPYPDVYQFACERIHVRAEHCIAVEDSPNGVTSAYLAGCKVAMVPDLTEPDEVVRDKTIGVVKDLRGILELLPKEA